MPCHRTALQLNRDTQQDIAQIIRVRSILVLGIITRPILVVLDTIQFWLQYQLQYDTQQWFLPSLLIATVQLHQNPDNLMMQLTGHLLHNAAIICINACASTFCRILQLPQRQNCHSCVNPHSQKPSHEKLIPSLLFPAGTHVNIASKNAGCS